MEVYHKIDFGSGFVEVPAPSNFDDAEIDVIFTKDKARASLANLTLVWKKDTAKKIFDIFKAGANGGKGVSYSLPYKVGLCNSFLEFDLMLVLGHSTALYSCDEVAIPAWQAQGADWFEKETQAYSFWHLYKNLTTGQPGKISFSDFKKTPYTIATLPNYTQILSLSFQSMILIWKLRELILQFTDNTTEVTADLGESAVPVAGTPHIIVTVLHVIRIIIRIIEIIGYLILIANYVKQLKENFIQSKKYKLCMREKDLWLKMSDFLGLTFSSPIYAAGSKFEHATWMPSKVVMPKTTQTTFLNNLVQSMFDRPENEINNTKSHGYFDGQFSQFITTMETKYNAEAKVINGVLEFKNKHDWNVNGAYQLPNTGDVGYTFRLPAPFRTNLFELAPYYQVSFEVDPSDLTTLHRYRGTTAAVQVLTPFPIDKYSGWGQGQLVSLGSALAKRKYYLTKEEEFVNNVLNVISSITALIIAPINLLIAGINAILSAINAIISLFGGGLNTIGKISPIKNPIPKNLLGGRIGWMETSGDSFSFPKTFIGVDVGGDWELDPQTETNMSAITLLNDAHGTNLATRGNQYLLYNNNKSKFCCDEFFAIQNKNILVTPDGKAGKFDSMKWKLVKESATDINYRIKEIYLSGLKEKVIIDGTP